MEFIVELEKMIKLNKEQAKTLRQQAQDLEEAAASAQALIDDYFTEMEKTFHD